jgi:hypothetical protein
MFGDVRTFQILVFLADETMAVNEINPPNSGACPPYFYYMLGQPVLLFVISVTLTVSLFVCVCGAGRDPFPQFAKRAKLPKPSETGALLTHSHICCSFLLVRCCLLLFSSNCHGRS